MNLRVGTADLSLIGLKVVGSVQPHIVGNTLFQFTGISRL
jgi:hypothetical protein